MSGGRKIGASHKFPWTVATADEAIRARAQGMNYRQISAHLGQVFSRPTGETWPPDPATIRRLCLKRKGMRS